jgi:hypothetical protein
LEEHGLHKRNDLIRRSKGVVRQPDLIKLFELLTITMLNDFHLVKHKMVFFCEEIATQKIIASIYMVI